MAGESIRDLENIACRLTAIKSAICLQLAQPELVVVTSPQDLMTTIARAQFINVEKVELKKDLKWLINRISINPGMDKLPMSEAMQAHKLVDEILQVI